MTDIIVVIILVIIFTLVILYMKKEKKRGVVCIGCPNAGTCQKKNCADDRIDTDIEQK